mgnify:CR=1 FL=1
MICENCQKEHNGSYGSGRFCSKECARSFSTKNEQKTKKMIICNQCKKEFLIDKRARNDCLCDECKNVELICYNCNKPFYINIKNANQKFCSRVCSSKYVAKTFLQTDEHKEKLRKITKEKYKNGKQVFGGKTKWFQYKEIKVQGTYELRTCYILDKLKDLKLIKNWEYTNDRYEYLGYDNNKHFYLLDFKVFNNDDSFYYIETKGRVVENDKYKWNTVKDFGYKLEIWFDDTIRYYENKYMVTMV